MHSSGIHKCVLSHNSSDYPLPASAVTMAANNAVPSGLWRDILVAALSAYMKSHGIRVLTLHYALCHNKEKHEAQEIRLTAYFQLCCWQRLQRDWTCTRGGGWGFNTTIKQSEKQPRRLPEDPQINRHPFKNRKGQAHSSTGWPCETVANVPVPEVVHHH